MELGNKDWGYKIISPTSLHFYHVLLPRLGYKFLTHRLKFFEEIEILQDDGLILHTKNEETLSKLVGELEEFLTEIDTISLTTPNFTYKIKEVHKNFLREWSLALEGCVALILFKNLKSFTFDFKNFELINSQIGGIYIHPYTILFYEDHVKVIHPINRNNYFIREEIEQVAASSIKGILQRVENAQRGFEGIAMLSYVESKTKFSQDYITRIINEKTWQVRYPKFSPLFRN